MPCGNGRRGMVAGHHEHVRLQLANGRNQRVQFLKRLHLGVKVPVLSGSIGGLVVDEKEVVGVEVLPQSFDFVGEVPVPSGSLACPPRWPGHGTSGMRQWLQG